MHYHTQIESTDLAREMRQDAELTKRLLSRDQAQADEDLREMARRAMARHRRSPSYWLAVLLRKARGCRKSL